MYELSPKYFLSIDTAIYYFLIPVIIPVLFLNLFPKFSSSIIKTERENSLEYIPNDSVLSNELFLEKPFHENIENQQVEPIQNIESGQEFPSSIIPESVIVSALDTQSTNNSAIQDIIEKKIEPVGDEISKIKVDTTTLKDDMNTIKTSIGDMFSKFEDAMIDLKSLQSEITNPLNFIQKKVDSNEIGNFLSVQNPEQIERLAIVPHASYGFAITPQDTKETKPRNEEERSTSSSNSSTNELNNFKGMFDEKLTLGKLMSIVSLVDEMTQRLGDNSAHVLAEQCKIMGLNPDIENTVHSIAKMLSSSSMSITDTLILLYRLGQIVGVNDKEADMNYVKLITAKNNTNPGTDKILREEYF